MGQFEKIRSGYVVIGWSEQPTELTGFAVIFLFAVPTDSRIEEIFLAVDFL
jgi:hypothetical protein